MGNMSGVAVLCALELILVGCYQATAEDRPNIWNFDIARKTLGAFSFEGMGLSLWEDKTVSDYHSTYYVTPLARFLPNSTQCETNMLIKSHVVRYAIEFWNEQVVQAAIDRLNQMGISDVHDNQVQPVPFYEVRVQMNSLENMSGAQLNPKWNSNLQQHSVHPFTIVADNHRRCMEFAESVVVEYRLSAESSTSRTLEIKEEHLLSSNMVASLRNMADLPDGTRYLRSDDMNRLTSQVSDKILASDTTWGDYVTTADEISLANLIGQILERRDTDTSAFTDKTWESVFWDPANARPDRIASQINKLVKIDSGQNRVVLGNAEEGSSHLKTDDKYHLDNASSYSNQSASEATRDSASSEGGEVGLWGIFSGSANTGSTSHSQDRSASALSASNDLSQDLSRLFEKDDAGKTAVSVDVFRRWLDEHNLGVEVQGDLVRPRSMRLSRINLGDLKSGTRFASRKVAFKPVESHPRSLVTVSDEEFVTVKSIREQLLQQLQETLSSKVDSDLKNGLEGVRDKVGKNLQEVQTKTTKEQMEMSVQLKRQLEEKTDLVNSSIEKQRSDLYSSVRRLEHQILLAQSSIEENARRLEEKVSIVGRRAVKACRVCWNNRSGRNCPYGAGSDSCSAWTNETSKWTDYIPDLVNDDSIDCSRITFNIECKN